MNVLPTLTSVWQLFVTGHVLTSAGTPRTVAYGFHFRETQHPLSPPTKSQIATGFNALYWPVLAANLHNSWIGDGIYVKSTDDATDTLTLAGVPTSGTSSGMRLPLTQAVFFGLQTDYRGKSFFGRKHWGPVPQSFVTDDEINSFGAVRCQVVAGELGNFFFFSVGALNYEFHPVVVSQFLSQLGSNPTTIIGAPVTFTYYDTTLSSWRHRREKVQR